MEKVEYDLSREYDMTTFQGRFRYQRMRILPTLMLHSTARIETARDELANYYRQFQAAKEKGEKYLMTP